MAVQAEAGRVQRLPALPVLLLQQQRHRRLIQEWSFQILSLWHPRRKVCGCVTFHTNLKSLFFFHCFDAKASLAGRSSIQCVKCSLSLIWFPEVYFCGLKLTWYKTQKQITR